MYIVFDTCIWRSQFGFNSPAGAAVRFYIQQCGATVAIPEVVRLEVERVFRSFLQGEKKKIVESHRQLLTVFGKLKEVVLPSDEEICAKASEIINCLDVPMQEIPFSLEAAKSSLLKTIDKLPPSNNSQQFKDGVIWADCMKLLEKADVYLVSKDKAFYKGGEYQNGLASNLLDEAKNYSHCLKLISDLGDLLKDIRTDIAIDENKLLDSVLEKSGEAKQWILEEEEFSLMDSPIVMKKLFSTENSKRLYIEFEILYHCPDATDRGRPDATLSLQGSGSYETEKQEFLDINLTNMLFQYIDLEGQRQSRNHYYVSAQPIFLGQPTVKHTVKSLL
ncbi:MAG: PIN domain-containing protein [Nitrospinae bacterium]|nr:PIN domain-containing protein [Nitrospinota bacterium]